MIIGQNIYHIPRGAALGLLGPQELPLRLPRPLFRLRPARGELGPAGLRLLQPLRLLPAGLLKLRPAILQLLQGALRLPRRLRAERLQGALLPPLLLPGPLQRLLSSLGPLLLPQLRLRLRGPRWGSFWYFCWGARRVRACSPGGRSGRDSSLPKWTV